MEKRHIVDLKGKQFVTYEGLLNEATKAGLVGIKTTLIQAPNDANGQTAIMHAQALFQDGRSFEGIGDANPTNVGRMIIPHAIRMAETRSKGRALRDALNIGMCSLEELGGDDTPEPSRSQAPVRQAAAKPEPETENSLATRAQIDRVTKEMKRTGFTQEQGRTYLIQHFGKSSRLELTGDEIEKFINHLAGMTAAPIAG